ncbi:MULTISPECIES: hypothetical protein [unclassified Mammaliicoccus]|nr:MULTISPECIES: hypothetical protein [unclassified Mammaliicoccus]
MSQFNHNYHAYMDYLYVEIFKKYLYNNKVYYNGKPIALKKYPIECDREYTFFHLTTVSDKKGIPFTDREPDLRRCERLHWIKPAIETNHLDLCYMDCFIPYTDNKKGKYPRVKFFNELDRYLIVLEDRGSYYLLITAFYIEQEYYLKGIIKEKDKAKNAP